MSQSELEAQIAAFIDANGVTRCPTACVVRTQGTVSQADRSALQHRAAEMEAQRSRRRFAAPFAIGRNAGLRPRVN